MNTDFLQWITWFFRFCYNALYSVNLPGLNIPVLYVLIFVSLMNLLIILVRRVLYQPTRNGTNIKKSIGGDG